MKYLWLSILFIITSNSIYSKGTVDKVEPPFWWSGMQHPTLQLLIHGDSLAYCEAQIHDPNIQILRQTRGESPNYIFLDLQIENAPSRIYEIELYDDSELVEAISYELKERIEDASEIAGFDNSDVLYLITPDRFANGDTSNDEVTGMREGSNRSEPFGRHGGDIQGISDHLDYIKELGFTAIWLNPVLENDQEQESYHGYSTTDYYRVDPRFGSNEEYKALSEKAASMDIKLIMDMIENHCGSFHWWMSDLPFAAWINNPETYIQTNHRKSTLHDPYVSKEDRETMVNGWFVPTMPDLNQKNPLLSEYLIQNSIWWVEYLKLAGIRQDTYSYPDPDFMSDWTCRIMSEYPNMNIVAEEWTSNIPTVAYWQAGKENHDGYTSCLPSMMDFPLNAVIAPAFSRQGGLSQIYETLGNDFLYADPYRLVIFPDNHDMSRIYTQVNEDFAAYKMAIAFVLTMRGTPQLYYGTEILMSNPGTNSHGIIRSDFPGGWDGDRMNAFQDMGLSDLQLEAKAFVKKLLNWRKDKSVIHDGALTHYVPENNVYVYFRYNDNDKVMVIFNKNAQPVNLTLERFTEFLQSEKSAKDIVSDREISLGEELTLPASSVMVLEF